MPFKKWSLNWLLAEAEGSVPGTGVNDALQEQRGKHAFSPWAPKEGGEVASSVISGAVLTMSIIWIVGSYCVPGTEPTVCILTLILT